MSLFSINAELQRKIYVANPASSAWDRDREASPKVIDAWIAEIPRHIKKSITTLMREAANDLFRRPSRRQTVHSFSDFNRQFKKIFLQIGEECVKQFAPTYRVYPNDPENDNDNYFTIKLKLKIGYYSISRTDERSLVEEAVRQRVGLAQTQNSTVPSGVGA